MTIVYESDAEPVATRFDRMHEMFEDQLPLDIRLTGEPETRKVRFTVGSLARSDAAFSFVVGMVAMPGEIERIDAIQRGLFRGLSEWDTGRALPNFLGADSDPGSVKRAYEEADYERLREIKAAYDPHNFFRINHNIPPAA